MLDISKHLVATHANVSVLLVSGAPMVQGFRMSTRIDYIKLPCLSRTLSGSYDVKFLDLGYEDTIRLRTNLLTNALLDFSPDLILVDKKPLGVGNELSAALELLQRRAVLPKLVLLLRDILDSPETTPEMWKKHGYHQAVRSVYDQLLEAGSNDG